MCSCAPFQVIIIVRQRLRPGLTITQRPGHPLPPAPSWARCGCPVARANQEVWPLLTLPREDVISADESAFLPYAAEAYVPRRGGRSRDHYPRKREADVHGDGCDHCRSNQASNQGHWKGEDRAGGDCSGGGGCAVMGFGPRQIGVDERGSEGAVASLISRTTAVRKQSHGGSARR
jgi:hypothetical protein